MGLFSMQPEEPTEWGGLPSEPARPETTAERLADAATVELGGLGVGDLAPGVGGTVESILIPVKPATEIIQAQESGEEE